MEDETSIANLEVWPKLFDAIAASSGARMIGVWGRARREGEVMHHVVYTITDIFSAPSSVGDRTAAFPLPHRSRLRILSWTTHPKPTQRAKSSQPATCMFAICISTRSR